MVRIMLCDVKSGTFTVAKVNEDAYGVSADCAWVLDGSTGLNGKRLVADEQGSDAQWYAAAFSNFLKENLMSEDETLPEIFSRGVTVVWNAFCERAGGTVAKEDVPCTLGTAVRLKDGFLEYINVGDCLLLVRKKDGSVMELLDDTLCAMDANTLNLAMEIAKSKDILLCECRKEILPELRRVRMTMNTPEGYISLANDAQSVLKAKNGKIPTHEIQQICLLSDGFGQYFKLFSLTSDAASFMDRIASAQPRDLFDELLQAQKDDATLMNYPRFKLSDDSTIVYASI